jgi:predicted nuclease of predicted toxin-antitoxin system
MLVQLGYPAIPSKKLISEASQDPLVAALCDQLGAVLISHDRDMKGLIARRPNLQQRQFKNAHLIKCGCKQWRIEERVKASLPIILREYELRKKMNDRRMIVYVETDFLRVWR